MRFYGLALASAVVLSACGGDKGGENTETGSTPAMDSGAMAGGSTMTPAPGAAGGAMITGTTHDVKMIGDDKGYRFEPANITVKNGDGIKFTTVSGGPHNVAFDPAKVAAAKAALMAGMPEQMGELMGPMKMNAGEVYTISLNNVPAGKYPYNCTPHLSQGMVGTITVQ